MIKVSGTGSVTCMSLSLHLGLSLHLCVINQGSLFVSSVDQLGDLEIKKVSKVKTKISSRWWV